MKPAVAWLKTYSGSAFVKDLIAGLVLSILLVPQAMAYAQLAGLPPETGLFAALFPPILYAIFGSSLYVSLGPVALVSLIVADATAGSDPAGVTIIALQAGAILCTIGALGLGRLVNFISEPALLGFTAAAAVLIAFSQLPTLLGITTDRAGDLPTALSGLLNSIGELEGTTAIIGIVATVLLLILGKFAAPALWKIGLHPPWRQAVAKSLPLLVIIGAALLAARLNDVATVEPISGGLPTIPWPLGDLDLWVALLPSSLAVAVIIFVTATAVSKSLAGSDRRALDSSREAFAVGAGNIVAAMTGGYAVGASLSRSALVEESGAVSPIASVVASGVVLLTLLLLAPLLAYLPTTALAALVISAVFGLIKVRAIRSVWRHDRLEGWIIIVCFLATLAFGVRMGLLIGASVSLIHHLWFSSVPRVTRVGTDDGGVSFRSIDRDDVMLETLPVLVLRIDRSIFFGNAEFVEDEINKLMGRHEEVTCLVLDMRAVNDIDASGAAMLDRLAQRLRLKHVTLHFAAVHQPVYHRLSSLADTGFKCHRTVGKAVADCGVELDHYVEPAETEE
ncbi:SulP family inorganic anion transporter [Sphingomicrobium sp. XHP0239]|uniref:SulP family inorganic anion transporter n=1 Tax=Sphingomicrobium maritimum TaxID=3133972 RepID=UPI0031CC46FB